MVSRILGGPLQALNGVNITTFSFSHVLHADGMHSAQVKRYYTFRSAHRWRCIACKHKAGKQVRRPCPVSLSLFMVREIRGM